MATQREYQEVEQPAAGEVLVLVSESPDGELAATLSWGDWISDGLTRHGDTVGPLGVGEALLRADEVAALYGFDRVVVSLPSADKWNPQWGRLRRRAAVDDDDLSVVDDGDEDRAPMDTPLEDDDGRVANP